MQVEELLRAGRLDDALAALKPEVRRNPAQGELRLFLFHLLALVGDWERAMTQLKVLRDLDPDGQAMAAGYGSAVQSEVLRQEVFGQGRAPVVFGEPAPWLAPLIEALHLSASGEYAKSQVLREQAFQAAPPSPGTINDEPFEWIADMDSRLGPVVEAIVDGRYYWVPFQRIREIHLEKPKSLGHAVWMPAHFVWANEGVSAGLIPTRYPGSESNERSDIRMARRTEWTTEAGPVYLGQGQRIFATDAGEYALMDVREVRLHNNAPAEGEGSGSHGP